jgi:hypothetical protein
MLVVQETVAVVPVVVAVGVLMTSAEVRLRLTDADLVGSCVLVAVSTADVPVEGAVKLPVEVIVPAVADQV